MNLRVGNRTSGDQRKDETDIASAGENVAAYDTRPEAFLHPRLTELAIWAKNAYEPSIRIRALCPTVLLFDTSTLGAKQWRRNRLENRNARRPMQPAMVLGKIRTIASPDSRTLCQRSVAHTCA